MSFWSLYMMMVGVSSIKHPNLAVTAGIVPLKNQDSDVKSDSGRMISIVAVGKYDV